MLHQEKVLEAFVYDEDTGLLYWRHDRPRDHFKSYPAYCSYLKRWAGKVAGHIEEQGYRVIVFEGQSRKAHKLVWLYKTGEWIVYPEAEIDHENGIRGDNRFSNLFKVTKSQNQRNGSMRVNNKSGVIGVNWKKSKQRWVARIWDGPHHKYLGMYRNLEDAKAARATAEIELGYHQGHGKPRAVMH